MKVKCKVDRDANCSETPSAATGCTTAECLRCGHITESFGTGEASVKRCLAVLRDECPNNEENFYVDEDE